MCVQTSDSWYVRMFFFVLEGDQAANKRHEVPLWLSTVEDTRAQVMQRKSR
jgi:hypothetical protein